ncbi:MAG: ferrous iron transport protein B [Candidatus Sumerlaeaceae bacterium]|nr:ferrous iron transport protein B [Candidatus Sumerlaeaceae bacterium]
MSNCHTNTVETGSSVQTAETVQKLIICGPPNVGKSLIFNRLTGRHATVSNYPGTTVEISSGHSALLPGHVVSDTPGAYSLMPITDEERVSRDVLMESEDAVLLHVVDAKNLRRMLPMTIELLELGRRVVLVLNMMDEARQLQVQIDSTRLSELLGIPVIETVATSNEGITGLCHVIRDGIQRPNRLTVHYPRRIQRIMETESGSAPDTPMLPTRFLASPAAEKLTAEELGDFELTVRVARQEHGDQLLGQCAHFPPPSTGAISGLLNKLTMNFWTAIPLALAVLYFGVYEFVGGFGAGTLVDFLENSVYETYVTPFLTHWTEKIIPWVMIQDLIVHDYGVLTLGLRYAVALILPVVGTFFLLFSVLEDSGYLPRLALLLDRLFKKLGLNGRAVIPIVIGFGCGTMATVVTRILETKRERIIATLLLGFAIPCSAQLGVVLGMLAQRPAALVAWAGILASIFLVLGFITSKNMPGEAPAFYLEMPPLRMPRLGNVLTKTYSRMHWYFLEILPLFLAASVIIWLGNITGLFAVIIAGMAPLVKAMGLPVEASPALLFGFFRRDYGAAGLFDLQNHGQLDARQTFVAVLVISLFLPCIAQFMVMKKERGWRFALMSTAAILVTATGVGLGVNAILVKTGWM